MKKLIIACVLILTGCANPPPFCTAYVKSAGATGAEWYGLRVEKARIKQVRTHPVELRTKYGWWDVSQFDMKYGDCKVKLEESGYLK